MIQIQKTREEFQQKLYSGIAGLNIIALNPSKDERNKIFNTTSDKEPEYIKKVKDKDVNDREVDVTQVRLNFVGKTASHVKCNAGIDTFLNVSIFLKKNYWYSRKNGVCKVQVIDKYGRTAWVTEEELKEHKIPMYANGPAKIDSDYRPSFIGEEELVSFLKHYFAIPSCETKSENGTWVMRPESELSQCVVRLELKEIEDLFNGNYTTLRSYIKTANDYGNVIKVAFGVVERDGQWNQCTLNKMFISSGTTSYSKVQEYVMQEQSEGRLKNQIYEIGDLHEYVINNNIYLQANQSNNVVENLPFSGGSSSSINDNGPAFQSAF